MDVDHDQEEPAPGGPAVEDGGRPADGHAALFFIVASRYRNGSELTNFCEEFTQTFADQPLDNHDRVTGAVLGRYRLLTPAEVQAQQDEFLQAWCNACTTERARARLTGYIVHSVDKRVVFHDQWMSPNRLQPAALRTRLRQMLRSNQGGEAEADENLDVHSDHEVAEDDMMKLNDIRGRRRATFLCHLHPHLACGVLTKTTFHVAPVTRNRTRYGV